MARKKGKEIEPGYDDPTYKRDYKDDLDGQQFMGQIWPSHWYVGAEACETLRKFEGFYAKYGINFYGLMSIIDLDDVEWEGKLSLPRNSIVGLVAPIEVEKYPGNNQIAVEEIPGVVIWTGTTLKAVSIGDYQIRTKDVSSLIGTELEKYPSDYMFGSEACSILYDQIIELGLKNIDLTKIPKVLEITEGMEYNDLDDFTVIGCVAKIDPNSQTQVIVWNSGNIIAMSLRSYLMKVHPEQFQAIEIKVDQKLMERTHMGPEACVPVFAQYEWLRNHFALFGLKLEDIHDEVDIIALRDGAGIEFPLIAGIVLPTKEALEDINDETGFPHDYEFLLKVIYYQQGSIATSSLSGYQSCININYS